LKKGFVEFEKGLFKSEKGFPKSGKGLSKSEKGLSEFFQGFCSKKLCYLMLLKLAFPQFKAHLQLSFQRQEVLGCKRALNFPIFFYFFPLPFLKNKILK